MTHKKMVCTVADEIGRFHRPIVYQREVRERFGIDVSASSVVKAIGAYKSRRVVDTRLAEARATALLHSCFWDIFQAKSLLDKVSGQ